MLGSGHRGSNPLGSEDFLARFKGATVSQAGPKISKSKVAQCGLSAEKVPKSDLAQDELVCQELILAGC